MERRVERGPVVEEEGVEVKGASYWNGDGVGWE